MSSTMRTERRRMPASMTISDEVRSSIMAVPRSGCFSTSMNGTSDHDARNGQVPEIIAAALRVFRKIPGERERERELGQLRRLEREGADRQASAARPCRSCP